MNSLVDRDMIRSLILAAHEACPPDNIGDGEFKDIEFDLQGGWKVVFSYDCGELDYIDHFVTTDGTVVEIWGTDADPRLADNEDGAFTTLQNWRSTSDTSRLLASLASADSIKRSS